MIGDSRDSCRKQQNALHEAVARAIAESVGGASLTPGDDDYAAAAAAIRVVLAEAQQHRGEAVKAATQAMWDEDGRSDTIPLGNLSRRLAAELAVDATLAMLAALGRI